MPGPRALLKTVLLKSINPIPTMESRNHAILAYGDMESFINLLKLINGGDFVKIDVHVEVEDVRQMLKDTTMPALLNAVRRESSQNYAKLNAIDWRKLFGIEPETESNVRVEVIPASDDDSGAGSLTEH